ncbi:MAG: BNR-repeat neuraminidase N-terminal domain-containing protein, partial [Bacteroidota bacterium]
MKLTLKIKLLVIFCAFLSNQSFAQVSTYAFNSSAGTYTPITGTTLFGGGWDDGASFMLTIPFSFNYNLVNYSTVSVGANGFITLGTQAINNGYCGLGSGMVNSVAGYCTDLEGSPTSSILYTTRGATPNRQFVVQWTDCDHWNNSNLNHWTFQIILNETSNAVQVVWGNSTDATFTGPNNCVDVSNESGDVGLIGNSAADLNIRMVTNGVNTWATSVAGTLLTDVCNMSPTNIPANGLTYTWTPLPPTPMVFISSTTTFVNNLQGVARNSTNPLLRVEVVTSGTLTPFNVNSLNLSTTGCTNAAGDILNAKIYFTGQSSVYSTANQFGTTLNNPNGTYTVNGSATLSFGTNYFWVSYGLTATATINDSLRACCTQITGSGTMGNRTPTVTCPGGYQIITALGYWTPVANLAPDQNAGVMILLTDGTVIAKTASGSADGIGTVWDKLTPDIHGSYTNGTWSQTTPMSESRLYFSSQVLQDGRVYVAGGEYGSGGSLGEVYDPIADTWTNTPPQGQRISDANSEILPDGKVLQALVNQGGPVLCDFYNPTSNSYTPAPSCLGSHNESTWVKLPDESVLMIDMPTTASERYIPSLNQWIPDATVPIDLYDAFGSETGAGLLLPDGRAFFLGSTGHTAYYTPSGNNTPGSWATGPDIPSGNGQCDAPAAMMVDGKILLTAAPAPIDNSSLFASPTVFFEYNYLSNSYTQITAPDGSPSVPIACYQTNLLL